MDIVRIFEDDNTFWCAHYPTDSQEIIGKLFEQWSDTEYLVQFFTRNKKDLINGFWGTMSIDSAVSAIKDEVHCLEEKLICIVEQRADCFSVSVADIFEQFDKGEFVLKQGAERFVKAKIDSIPQMLRLYGVKLEDGTIIISGGAIKISHSMDRNHLAFEKARLIRLDDYLKSQSIYTLEGLIN